MAERTSFNFEDLETPPSAKDISLTPNETKALRAWFETNEDFDVLSFATIARRSRLRRNLVRRTVRALARKGVTRFVRGCWNEDGEPTGSGYGLTTVGRQFMIERRNIARGWQ